MIVGGSTWLWRRGQLLAAVLLTAVVAVAAVAPAARADGDPGSDVLVYQDLFAGSDAGLSVQQQVQLGALLKAAARAGFPVRVAIIATPSDLGAVTALWHNPRGYAQFLGVELSLAYRQRLLVVMPNGFGFNWPGHSNEAAYSELAKIPIGRGGSGLFTATEAAVRKLGSSSGVKLPAVARVSGASAKSNGAGNATAEASSRRRATENTLGIIALVLIALVVLAFGVRRALGQRSLPRPRFPGRPGVRLPSRGRGLAIPGGALLLIAVVVVTVIVVRPNPAAQSQAEALATNPYLDPGTPLSGGAPDFSLSDQFGRPVSLHSFRGKVVLLAFNDSECTTMCPLTTTAMLDAKAMLGRAGSRVELLGIDANPAATSLEDVWSYSELHGMLHAWHFLTGSLPQLKQVWKQYGVEAAVERGQITHTPALFVIDPAGRKADVYITQMSYSATGQLGQLLAQEASKLLPGHPPVHSDLSYARVPPTTPSQQAVLPRAGGGSVQLGPGKAARLFLFFATWIGRPAGSRVSLTRSTATRGSPAGQDFPA